MTDIPDGVVERVAEALWRAEWAEGHAPPHSWDAMCSEDWDIAEAFRVQARAALEAAKWGELGDCHSLVTAVAKIDDSNPEDAAVQLRWCIKAARALLSSIGASQQ